MLASRDLQINITKCLYNLATPVVFGDVDELDHALESGKPSEPRKSPSGYVQKLGLPSVIPLVEVIADPNARPVGGSPVSHFFSSAFTRAHLAR